MVLAVNINVVAYWSCCCCWLVVACLALTPAAQCSARETAATRPGTTRSRRTSDAADEKNLPTRQTATVTVRTMAHSTLKKLYSFFWNQRSNAWPLASRQSGGGERAVAHLSSRAWYDEVRSQLVDDRTDDGEGKEHRDTLAKHAAQLA